jgi:hypothetical protein
VVKFDYKNFFKNSQKQIIYIGGWLRNIYSFYSISLPTQTQFQYGFLAGDFNSCIPIKTIKQSFTKSALKGKNMNNYYPESNFTSKLCKSLEENNCSSNDGQSNCSTNNGYSNCSTNGGHLNCSTNGGHLISNWNKHFYEDICNKINSMNIIQHVNNDDYDKLITENVVFINLVDASAVNTLIECIVRHTPIIINKHPAVVELLGEKYPLYFTSQNYNDLNIEINNILRNDRKIHKAYLYLKKISLDQFNILVFINQLIEIIKKL